METTTYHALEFANDHAPTYCESVADLYSWASNFDDFKPFAKFLDLIGYGYDLGLKFAKWDDPTDGLGHIELSKLAGALEEYANRPYEVTRWIEQLLDIESEQGL